MTRQLFSFLRQAGADLVGAADMEAVENCPYPRAVAMAVALPVQVLQELEHGPTAAYCAAKREIDGKLDRLCLLAAEFLQRRGFQAMAQTTKAVQKDEQWRTPVPHKTAATRAGLGWIGKSCLLVTCQFGSAVRLTSVLTDAPLACGRPVERSQCGECTLCQSQCPAGALTGAAWQAGMERETLFARKLCKTSMLEQQAARGLEEDVCGRCFAVCPYTKRYVRRRQKEESL